MSEFEGVINNLERRYKETTSDWAKWEIEQVMTACRCPDCNGTRLKPEILSVTVGGKNISQFCDMSIVSALDFIDNLELTDKEKFISESIIKEIKSRLKFLHNVGLEYLTLSRTSGTLSGGESQRIRLATQIGSSLMGVVYILDEPSIGLHQRDNDKLLGTLKGLRDLGNTLIVVPKNATNKKIKWKSAKKKYATVNNKGKVKTKKAGKGHTVKITAVSVSNPKIKASVKIKIK